ncbi:hypothetical protein CDL15_Pgr019022 [Punica granatum]|uniref:non-specific serine/threonine protein kinase n=1 Tax=Punica granatum TaxID=22663 RepID=A0A218XKQ3_PUNGR|nr:hypothetical protein CDL15_Pgr019022 [Punica granatum]PKH47693.1 hypothetical protein CRG98_050477 [Punica granatum]
MSLTKDHSASAYCPMSFDSLEKLVSSSDRPLKFLDIQTECQYILEGFRLVRSEYLQTTGYFFPPQNSSEACWLKYQRVVNLAIDDFHIQSTCGFKTNLISDTCLNISTQSDFKRLIPEAKLQDVLNSCNQSLEDDIPCQGCKSSVEGIQSWWSSLQGPFNRNESDCSGYPFVYAAGFVNQFSPTDSGTFRCLFRLDFRSSARKRRKQRVILRVIVAGCINGLLGALVVMWLLWAWHLRRRRKKEKMDSITEVKSGDIIDRKAFQRGQLLSWPIRWRNALGTARGLAYLHNAAEPIVIHRDVKASNILLDDAFEPKLADFGLAKFTLEGLSHVSTRVAGTPGYVAPEYVLYGQLTERSDVYSFGVVLLQLLSGKKTVISVEDREILLLADWAWAQVRDKKVLHVVDERIPDLAVPEVMEKYVLLAVLCSHPILHARPSMEQVVKILETDSPVASIPNHQPTEYRSGG